MNKAIRMLVWDQIREKLTTIRNTISPDSSVPRDATLEIEILIQAMEESLAKEDE